MQESTFTIPALSPSGLTWHAEGDDDRQSAYYSRKAHVPSSSSGVTIGRGYDLSSKPPGQIISELLSAGVSFRDTLKFSKGSGLKGVAAKSFI
ncbi:MAG: hypothetical protein DCC75_13155, partial [Proteobacteria bacterium]